MRSHDLIMQIAAQPGLAGEGSVIVRAGALIRHMSDTASMMWCRTADAWYQRDGLAAATLTRHVQEMDKVYADLTAELAASQMATQKLMA